ncbi:hypothetical protein HPOKI112_08150 [Helicobacter pylori oki112]|nr:hypothetical protein HPOKI102_08125 [Helicobacter pylori oki102]AHN36997.1 hypothetical protein HPOKI112_08150 [Helicobacter pylori oki112]AHN41297.1 hypothetical protein HPOKI422_08165 [Helicobacter pylori oki422]AHN45665.1 hypothetical protein HPOKI898_08135 [Helicobacter pylori oki898]
MRSNIWLKGFFLERGLISFKALILDFISLFFMLNV